MRLAIMQPYFLPYIGYYQLIGSVDVFVVYDNIKYTKKGWINRNRLLSLGEPGTFSLPLKKGSDSLDVREREVAADFNRRKLLNQFRGSYEKAPHFDKIFPLLEKIIECQEQNLFKLLFNSLIVITDALAIRTEIVISSTVDIDHDLHGQDKVLALCKAAGAETYINPIGGVDLYSKETFKSQGVDLCFLQPGHIEYKQFNDPFVPWLSIIDVLMFNSLEFVQSKMLNAYKLV